MSLRVIAEADTRAILEDSVHGFGYLITVTDPAGLQAPVIGYSGDIGLVIDPDTGQAVSGRVAHATINISTLLTAGFTDLPRGIEAPASKPWIMTFDDINGNSFTFKVSDAQPDRTLGIVNCILEFYDDGS